MITHNGKYLLHATHHGMPIVAATMGGKMVIGGWLLRATKQAIVAAFGAEGTEVIAKTNDYLNRIATTDPQRAQALAMFINEDPLLVCSLVETSKTRWLVGDGKAYVDMQEPPCYDSDFSIEFYAGTFTPRYVGFWGSGTGPTTPDRMDCYMYSADGRFCFYTTSQNFEYKIARDTPYTLRYDKGTASLLDASGKTLASGKTNKPSTTYKFNAYLFAFNRNGVLGGDTAGDNFVGGISKAEGILNTQPFHLCPFIRNGENGMLDIISGTFHTNANTQGSFTIAITDKTPA